MMEPKIEGYWYGIDGTTYAVVRPSEVGDRPRWWIDPSDVPKYQHVLEHGFGERLRWAVGPAGPSDLHMEPLCADDAETLALVVADREPGPSDTKLAALITAAIEAPRLVALRPGEVRAWLKGLPREETATREVGTADKEEA